MPTSRAHKLSVTVPADLARAVKKAVGGRGLSGFVTEALRNEMARRKLGAYLRKLDEELGPVPPKLMARMRREWPAP